MSNVPGAEQSQQSRARGRLLVIAVAVAFVALIAGVGVWALGSGGVPARADQETFCLWTKTAMTDTNPDTVTNAIQNLAEDGVPPALDGTAAHSGATVFIDMAEQVGAPGVEFWGDRGIADNRSGEERDDLLAFLDYAYDTCGVPEESAG